MGKSLKVKLLRLRMTFGYFVASLLVTRLDYNRSLARTGERPLAVPFRESGAKRRKGFQNPSVSAYGLASSPQRGAKIPRG